MFEFTVKQRANILSQLPECDELGGDEKEIPWLSYQWEIWAAVQ